MQGETKSRGYLYVIIEKLTLKGTEEQASVGCELQLGNLSRCATSKKQSGTAMNEVFLIEVPSDPQRLIITVRSQDQLFGECRYDIEPFFGHVGSLHSLESEFYDEKGGARGTANLKITYFSAEHGRLKVRVFSLQLIAPLVDRFKEASLKLKIGHFMHVGAKRPLSAPIDEDHELVILDPKMNLVFEVDHEEGVLASFTIYDLKQSGLMIPERKAYQVSLFNNEKAVGTIKYQIDWLQH